VLSFARAVRHLKVAVDTSNGCVGTIFGDVASRLPIEVIPLYFEPDGRFPNHEPNPLRDENLVALKAKVRESGADLGAAFDGDGDRCLFVDETGERVPNDLLTALVARDLLARNPGAAVVYDIRSSWAVREEILRAGGKPVPERVGHAFIKQTMRDRRAVYGGELSGHAYFRDNYFADSGLIAFVSLLNVLSAARRPFSKVLAPLCRYTSTGEVNFRVADKGSVMASVRRMFADGRLDERDGLTVEYDDWWFNVRPSNTEPYLRLCVEARTPEGLERGKARLLPLLGEPVE
jgi:phosphomannomutase